MAVGEAPPPVRPNSPKNKAQTGAPACGGASPTAMCYVTILMNRLITGRQNRNNLVINTSCLLIYGADDPVMLPMDFMREFPPFTLGNPAIPASYNRLFSFPIPELGAAISFPCNVGPEKHDRTARAVCFSLWKKNAYIDL